MDDTDSIARIEGEMASQVKGPNFFRIGLVLTIVYLLLISGIAVYAQSGIFNMKPNEWGDFLAGIFGPLALFWVVLGFLQQGAELRYSRDALLLQARELKASVEAQNNMADAAWASVNVERESQEAARLLQKRAKQPILVLHHGSSLISSGISRSSGFRLSNSGSSCLSLRLRVSRGDLALNKNFVARLDTGAEIPFSVEDDNSPLPSEFDLFVVYKDVEGEQFGRKFEIIVSDDTHRIQDEFGTATDP